MAALATITDTADMATEDPTTATATAMVATARSGRRWCRVFMFYVCRD